MDTIDSADQGLDLSESQIEWNTQNCIHIYILGLGFGALANTAQIFLLEKEFLQNTSLGAKLRFCHAYRGEIWALN